MCLRYQDILFLFLTEWSIAEVKEWAKNTFASDSIADKFENEEVDGKILLSPTVLSVQAMEALGLVTLGKKGKFAEALKELNGSPGTYSLYLFIKSLVLALMAFPVNSTFFFIQNMTKITLTTRCFYLSLNSARN